MEQIVKELKTEESLFEKIRNHGKAINDIFKTGLGPVIVSLKLRDLEKQAQELNSAYHSNTIEYLDFARTRELIVSNTKKILRYDRIRKKDSLYIYYDSNSKYALKLIMNNDDSARWYGLPVEAAFLILAPDFIDIINSNIHLIGEADRWK